MVHQPLGAHDITCIRSEVDHGCCILWPVSTEYLSFCQLSRLLNRSMEKGPNQDTNHNHRYHALP
jgi:hypothetical protein